MSTRLNNDIREALTRDIMRHRFTADVDALITEQMAFAGNVYDDLFPAAMQKQMNDLPDGWLANATDIGAQFGFAGGSGRYERLHFNGYVFGDLARLRTKNEDQPITRRVPASKIHGCAKVYDPSHKLAVAFERLCDKTTKLRETIQTAENSIKAALNAVTTTKLLVETWPEIAPFAAKYDTEKPQLPALPTQHLNSILNLPVDEPIAA